MNSKIPEENMLKIATQTFHAIDGACVASEVLARLQIGKREFTPHTFMHGCTPEGWHSLDLAVITMVAGIEEVRSSPVPIFVNVSPGTLENDEYMDSFCSHIEQQVSSRQSDLVIEIPELSSLSGQRLISKLRDIESAGAKLAIDDFGCAYAAQERLESYNWHYCKIDLGAVQQRTDLDWMEKAIRYSQSNAIQIIMEKIETFRDIEALSPVKKRAWFQGYCFSRPRTLDTALNVSDSRIGYLAGQGSARHRFPTMEKVTSLERNLA